MEHRQRGALGARRPAHRRPRRLGAPGQAGMRLVVGAVVVASSLLYGVLGPVAVSQAGPATEAELLEVRLAAAGHARRQHHAAVRRATLAAADLQADQAERAAADLVMALAAQAEADRLAAQAEAERAAAQAEADRLAARAAQAARAADAARRAEAARRAREAGAAAPRAVPAPAPGPDRSPGWEQRLGAQALARIRYPVTSLGYEILFLPGRSGVLGITTTHQRRIEIFVRPGHTVDDLAVTLAHEIGHAVDKLYNTPERRQAYLLARGLPAGLTWYGCESCSDFATPAGDYAEAFAVHQVGPANWQGRLGPAPSPAQLALLAPLFAP